jgi:uncharacterized membrane protein
MSKKAEKKITSLPQLLEEVSLAIWELIDCLQQERLAERLDTVSAKLDTLTEEIRASKPKQAVVRK